VMLSDVALMIRVSSLAGAPDGAQLPAVAKVVLSADPVQILVAIYLVLYLHPHDLPSVHTCPSDLLTWTRCSGFLIGKASLSLFCLAPQPHPFFPLLSSGFKRHAGVRLIVSATTSPRPVILSVAILWQLTHLPFVALSYRPIRHRGPLLYLHLIMLSPFRNRCLALCPK
jgi:hypothetical protein